MSLQPVDFLLCDMIMDNDDDGMILYLLLRQQMIEGNALDRRLAAMLSYNQETSEDNTNLIFPDNNMDHDEDIICLLFLLMRRRQLAALDDDEEDDDDESTESCLPEINEANKHSRSLITEEILPEDDTTIVRGLLDREETTKDNIDVESYRATKKRKLENAPNLVVDTTPKSRLTNKSPTLT